jgi:hypothetical protein
VVSHSPESALVHGRHWLASQCGNDRPGFGLQAVSHKLRAKTINTF